MKKHLLIFITVILIFAVIVLITGFLGNQFGKPAELIGLSIVALILLVLYVKTKRS